MALFDEDESRATAQSLNQYLTPSARDFLLRRMRQAPDLSFGLVKNPETLDEAAANRMFGGERWRTLLTLLRQQAAGLR